MNEYKACESCKIKNKYQEWGESLENFKKWCKESCLMINYICSNCFKCYPKNDKRWIKMENEQYVIFYCSEECYKQQKKFWLKGLLDSIEFNDSGESMLFLLLKIVFKIKIEVYISRSCPRGC